VSKGGIFLMEKLKEKHNLKMQKLKLQGELMIEENNIKNENSLNKLKAEKDQLKVNSDIRELKTIVRQDKTIINAGLFLNFWGTLGTVISTLLTIAGLYSLFNSGYFKTICFILAIVMIQFSVYLLSKQDTNIKKHFKQHAFKVNALKLVLLSISIYGNYNFFTTGRDTSIIDKFIFLALCVAIDFISIYCLAIAQDFKTLNKNVSKDGLYKGLIGKIIFNLTYKTISGIEQKYQRNINPQLKLLKPGNDRETGKQDSKNDISNNNKLETPVNDRDLKELLTAIFKYKDGVICPSVLYLSEKTNLTRTKINQLKKYLNDLGLLETTGNTTSLKVDDIEQAFKLIGGVNHG